MRPVRRTELCEPFAGRCRAWAAWFPAALCFRQPNQVGWMLRAWSWWPFRPRLVVYGVGGWPTLTIPMPCAYGCGERAWSALLQDTAVVVALPCLACVAIRSGAARAMRRRTVRVGPPSGLSSPSHVVFTRTGGVFNHVCPSRVVGPLAWRTWTVSDSRLCRLWIADWLGLCLLCIHVTLVERLHSDLII